MSTTPKLFGPKSLSDLRVRTEYEAWLLQATYEIADQKLNLDTSDEFVYPPSGALPTRTFYATAHIAIGDWRPGFLKAGAPLVLVTNFKMLDMLLEWILLENGYSTTHRFIQKIKALKGQVQFPHLIESRPWLKERLIALYERLEPLRGTIIHAPHFKSSDGTLEVASSKGGTVGPLVTVGTADLRNISVLMISLLHYLENTWTMNVFREKNLRWTCDALVKLHGAPSLNQLRPRFLNVCIYRVEEKEVKCDLELIRRDLAANNPGEDIVFNLRIITVSPDGSRATAYLLPWDKLQQSTQKLCMDIADIAPYAVQIPVGLDSIGIAREIKMTVP